MIGSPYAAQRNTGTQRLRLSQPPGHRSEVFIVGKDIPPIDPGFHCISSGPPAADCRAAGATRCGCGAVPTARRTGILSAVSSSRNGTRAAEVTSTTRMVPGSVLAGISASQIVLQGTEDLGVLQVGGVALQPLSQVGVPRGDAPYDFADAFLVEPGDRIHQLLS